MKLFRKVQYNSPVVLDFALLALLALVLGKATGGWLTAKLFCVYRSPLTDLLTYPGFSSMSSATAAGPITAATSC